MGLVGEVVPHDQLDDVVAERLAAIARTGPRARTAVKRDLNQRLPQADVALFFHAIRSPEMVEGMTAFLEKRDPEWPR
jgi:enoyl-CoA hydratase/carnithine racemase